MNNNIEITKSAQDHIYEVLAKDKAKYFRITVLGRAEELFLLFKSSHFIY